MPVYVNIVFFFKLNDRDKSSKKKKKNKTAERADSL